MSLADNLNALIQTFVRKPQDQPATNGDILNVSRNLQEVADSITPPDTPDLQSVTDAGASTTNSITADSFISSTTGNIKPYKVYAGVFNQSGVLPPEVTNEINDFGVVFTWTKVDPGIYNATLSSNVLTSGKTVVLQKSMLFQTTGSFILFPSTSPNSFSIQTINSSTLVEGDDFLVDTYIELRVFE
jgi:hypothetical protein